ncbi:Uncharacterized protein APZ42_020886 [Daphnia magna]|uniref:CxC3 like cysteine cluster domain-containing protein n=1 Tax=Daphnia magna TaxID=35525 RepID=A0A164X5F9_9CRUS|nr:Uncharacterized protein APZ42_020886 [Daphnia magna]
MLAIQLVNTVQIDLNNRYTIKTNKVHVAVPCFIPAQCQSCRSINTLTLELLKNKYMIVVTLLGRIDLNAASFTCHNPACGVTNEASVRNYVNAGYWTRSPTRTCTLFSQSYMVHWFHTKHQISLTAATKYKENPFINQIMFRTASSQYSYIQHKIDVDVKLNEFMRCKACVLPCKYCHFDVIFKLYRYKAARSGHLQYLFEDSIIISNAKIPRYVEEINILKPQKGYDNCGNSTYKAGKENTSRHRTQDETGLASACCRHEVVLVTANLKSGENYRIVNFFHHFLWTLDLLKVSEGHEMHVEWMLLTTLLVTSTSATTSFAIMMRMIKEMSGFLSVLHGRTHTWDFQVDNNGRWRDCACASLGEDEEQEQVFTRFARYGLVTKHMSPAFRNDHLSEVVVNHNKEKDYGMDYALVKRAKKV